MQNAKSRRYSFFILHFVFFFSSRRRHTRSLCDWSSDLCSSDLQGAGTGGGSPRGGPPARSQDPTTSFLTAATLIYAIGAGITAAAGTRLALQWILVKGFKVEIGRASCRERGEV